MSTQTIHSIQDIMRDVFENNQIIVDRNTTANDVEEWDSLNHIQLILEIEKRFGVKFNSIEILNWKNVGEICDSIDAKANK